MSGLIPVPEKPERLMVLLMVMTGCFLVYAALEYRIRPTLCTHQETLYAITGSNL
jgi:hypothetical protein